MQLGESLVTIYGYIKELEQGNYRGEFKPMPQGYGPRSNFISRVFIFGAVFFIAGLVWVLAIFFRSPFVTRVDLPVEQPLPFPHDLHVTGLGLDCRYCHVTVEISAFADFPPTHTCMACHSQILPNSPDLILVNDSFRSGRPIPWNRVHNLGDFAIFWHSIHVQQGFGCETCHGRVDLMPLVWKTETLYMEWCLECHRQPELFIRPREAVFEMGWAPPEDQTVLGARLVEEYKIAPAWQLTDCTVCHQ